MTHHLQPRQAGPTHLHGLVQLTTWSHVLTEWGGGPRVYSFARNSNRDRLQFYDTLLAYITQFLFQSKFRLEEKLR